MRYLIVSHSKQKSKQSKWMKKLAWDILCGDGGTIPPCVPLCSSSLLRPLDNQGNWWWFSAAPLCLWQVGRIWSQGDFLDPWRRYSWQSNNLKHCDTFARTTPWSGQSTLSGNQTTWLWYFQQRCAIFCHRHVEKPSPGPNPLDYLHTFGWNRTKCNQKDPWKQSKIG